MIPTIELHIFTNSTISSPSTALLDSTYKSFIKQFKKDIKVTIWCDPKPNIENSTQYINNLKLKYPIVNITESLSDGYVKAVKESAGDYLFMLEHDWEFLPTIKHSLDDILCVMKEDKLLHLRFNKRSNVPIKIDKELVEVTTNNITYCITPGMSNNPHIIDRNQYEREALQYVNIKPKSLGIEKELSNSPLTGAIYGSLNYPNTVNHKDGKHTTF